MDLFDEYPVMQDHKSDTLAYHHGKAESKTKKISIKDKMTDIDKCVSAAVSKYPGHILSMESQIKCREESANMTVCEYKCSLHWSGSD